MNRRILVVDDNADSAAIIRRILEAQHYDVLVARDGVEALDRLAQEKVELVLLDIMMPGMNGLEVLRRIKGDAATQRLPVILVTAKTHDDDVLDGYQYGADYYITKPFTRKQLLYGIELLLDKGESIG